MSSCGRVRKAIAEGWTPIIDGELQNLKMATLKLGEGASYTLASEKREYAIVLLQGECQISLESGLRAHLGPRGNPFEDKPSALFLSCEERATITTAEGAFLACGSAPARLKMANAIITPDQVGSAVRGAGNWSREVRQVCWSDNTVGNLLLAGETVVPSGNWATMPPHRHQYDAPGSEAPYEEVYFFLFSRPQGFGLIWQFDDEGALDQAYSLKNNDAVYIGAGYHPLACAPGAMLYQLTLMAGPRRVSQARVHPDYQYLLDDTGLQNQYTPRRSS